MLQTVNIRGAFLNAQFTSDYMHIYLRINKDIIPYWMIFSKIPRKLPTLQNKDNSYYFSTGFYMDKTVTFEGLTPPPPRARHGQSVRNRSTTSAY